MTTAKILGSVYVLKVQMSNISWKFTCCQQRQFYRHWF